MPAISFLSTVIQNGEIQPSFSEKPEQTILYLFI